MQYHPVVPTPMLRLVTPSAGYLVAADLHLGVEMDMFRRGIRLQRPDLAQPILDAAGPEDILVFLGDVKHPIGSTASSARLLERFFSAFEDRRCIIVKGNHDGLIERMVPDAEVVKHLTVGDMALVHGHAWPDASAMDARVLVTGHVHPVVSLGRGHHYKCWLRGRMNRDAVLEYYESSPEEFIVMPAFNPLVQGRPVTGGLSGYGPLFTRGMMDVDGALVYTLEGVKLGEVRGL